VRIVYDKEAVRSWGNRHEPGNTPDDLERKVIEKLTLIGKWMLADKVIFHDYDKGQAYYIIKGDKMLVLSALSTPIDGGWINFDEKAIPDKFKDPAFCPDSMKYVEINGVYFREIDAKTGLPTGEFYHEKLEEGGNNATS